MCLKWAGLCGEALFLTPALVKLSLSAPCGANHSDNFTPDLPSASSTSGCRPPQLGHHGNRWEASAGVGLSIHLYTSYSSLELRHLNRMTFYAKMDEWQEIKAFYKLKQNKGFRCFR